ncbi:hypothetical protein LDENG_00186220 [Lucifuga dentata]|nr:hypothetical protein LDENG_00186220 [Lucifuga dentata]
MNPFVICALLLIKVNLGDACASGRYTDSGQCCSLCPAGFGVEVECGKEDTKCTPCLKGTFSRSEGLSLCQVCGPGTFSEELSSTKPCQVCSQCADNEVEIRACQSNSDTLCMDKKLHILSRPSGSDGEDEGGSSNILAYVSVLAAVVLGLLLYVAYKCWASCKQKKALSKARAAELGTSPEGEKLQSDSGVFLDSHSLQDSQLSKGTKRDSKQDNRLYINLAPHRQEEVERLLQEGGGRGWRQLGAVLGYEPEQLDLFGRGEAPAHTLLSNWAQKEGSTLGLLCTALARVERPDVATVLTCPTQGVSVV